MALTDIMTSAVMSSWLEDYAEFSSKLPQNEPAALATLRHRAIGRFEEIGFPSTDLEDWRFTDVSEVARTRFRTVTGAHDYVSPAKVVPFSYVTCSELVFIDGRYDPTYSSICELPDEAVMGNLNDAIRTDPEKVQTHLGRYAPFEKNAFTALNTAFVRDGAFLFIPRDTVMREPIHLLYLSTVDGEPTVSYPRNLIVVDQNSEVTIIESYAGPDTGGYMTCPVTEIVVGQASRVEHYKIQHESLGSNHISTQHLYQAGDSTVVSQSMSFGGGFVRNDACVQPINYARSLLSRAYYAHSLICDQVYYIYK